MTYCLSRKAATEGERVFYIALVALVGLYIMNVRAYNAHERRKAERMAGK